MANAGIMHLSDKAGGRPYCGNRSAIMSTPEERASEGRICRKCDAIRTKRREKHLKGSRGPEDH